MKHLPYLLLVLILLAACANPGSGPDGGPYDETPPLIVSLSPQLGEKNAHSPKVTIYFNENIKVENAAEKLTISPPQIETPEIKVSGRRISVELLDSLRENTTYTIDFSDAIVDATEQNPFGNFTYYFSTGDRLDTMEVSGHVLAASNLEPIKGILVGLHADSLDSAFTARPFERVARTDSRGRFSVKGVAPGSYRIYALKDMDGDFKRTRGEMMAVGTKSIVPSSFPDVRYDTIWRDTIRYDTIRTIHYTHYVPDDIVLLAFSETATQRYFLKSQRENPEMFRIFFTAPSRHVPELRGLNFNADSLLLTQRTAGNDTLTYWLRTLDTPVVDSLHFTLTYECYNDSLQQNVLQTDTLQLTPKNTMARRKRLKEEEMEKWKKKLERRHKRGDYSKETPPVEYLSIKNDFSRRLEPDRNPMFQFEEPIVRLDTAGIHLSLKHDSIFLPAEWEFISTDEEVTMRFGIRAEWRYGQEYQLVIDSAALTGLSGKVNDLQEIQLSVGRESDYGAIFLKLPDADSTAVVQLLRTDDKVERQVPTHNGRADFFFVHPGKYYLRTFYDRNGNGRWDTGNFDTGQSPEEVYYFPTSIHIRANWDFEQTWRVKELPLTQQKPKELIKQKGESEKKTARSRNEERLRQLGR